MSKVEPVVKIENVVAIAALEHGVDLSAVVKAFPEVEYRPDEFPGLVFRLKRPRTTTLIFVSGKMICTGARSENEAGKALRNVIRTLKMGGVIITGKPEIKIVNMVASGSLGGTVDLLELYEVERSMRGRIMYEPEQFPGLIYRMEDPRAVILLFSTGKLICTGARRDEDVHRAVNKLHQELEDKGVIRYE